MPPNDIYRECRCTKCQDEPAGFKKLRYSAWNRHRKEDRELEERRRYRQESGALERGRLFMQVMEELRREEEAEAGAREMGQGENGEREIRITDYGEDKDGESEPDQDNEFALDFDVPWRANSRHLQSPAGSPAGSPPRSPAGSPAGLPAGSPPGSRPPSPPAIDYGSDEEDDYDPALANSDPPPVRLAYLNAMCDHIIRKHSVRDVEISLNNTLSCIRLCGILPPDLTLLTTLKSVRRRLGLSTSSTMVRVLVCTKCYKPYTMEKILTAEPSGACTRLGCHGIYMKIGVKKGEEVHLPAKLVIYTKVIPELCRMFTRPSFVQLLQTGTEENRREQAPEVLYNICDGTAWKNTRLGLRRVFRRDGTVSDEPRTPTSEVAVSSLGYGLFAAINVDWFALTKKHSSGAVYLAILNLPRAARYKVENVILACVISGPKEPKLEHLNFVLAPIVESFKKLYAGVVMDIYNKDLPQMVYMYPLMVGADSPARAKVQGVSFHSHKHRIGCDCEACKDDINGPKGYDRDSFTYVDQKEILKLAFLSKKMPSTKRVAKQYGLRWSVLNELPGWTPHGSAPFDPIHNLYLGIVKSLWGDVIEDGFLLSAEQKTNFKTFMDGLEWPSQAGRLPSPTTTALNRNKADEWRQLMPVLPIALWSIWRNENDEIPLRYAPPVPLNVKKKPTFTRDCASVWDAVLFLAISIHLLTSWVAYLPDIDRAQTYMQQYCQGLLRLKVHLKPNHHYAMHYSQYFRAYGPCYSRWLFPYERFNGLLEQIELNSHIDDMETTLMRFWIRVHRLHNKLENMPEDATAEELNILNQIARVSQDRGTLLAMTESLHGGSAHLRTSPIPRCFLDLCTLDETGDIYSAVLSLAQTLWPELNLISNMQYGLQGQMLVSRQVAKNLGYVYRNTIRYGSSLNARTHADRYALAQFGDHCHPVKILRHLQLTVADNELVVFSLVTRLDTEGIPHLPWSIYSHNLGYFIAVKDQYWPVEAILSTNLVLPVIYGSFSMRSSGQELTVVICYNRTGKEIFGGADDDLGDDVADP